MGKSTTSRRSRKPIKPDPIKPGKPYPTFPLFAHATKRWAKKIRQKLHYFGPWSDPDGALKKYLEQKDRLHVGLPPIDPATAGLLTIRELCNQFLTSARKKVDRKAMNPRSFANYLQTCGNLVEQFGRETPVEALKPKHFEDYLAEIAKRLGILGQGNEVTRVRTVFRYAFTNEEIPKPVNFGSEFKGPDKRAKLMNRHAGGKRMLESDEIRDIINGASVHLRAMVYLGINCGYGNTDCASLTLDALDLEKGWVTFPRPKTGIIRKCPLWPETVKALRESMAARPKPRNDKCKALVFLTCRGLPWITTNIYDEKQGTRVAVCDNLSAEVRRLLGDLGLRRGRIGFYGLRHSFETIGGEARDQVAVNFLMGHADGSMAENYRWGISDDRLYAVTNQIHAWLFDGKAVANV
jgi:integrase